MRDLRIRDLVDLVEAETTDGDKKLEKMFDWYYDRVKTTAQWILGAAASLVVGLILAYSKDELVISDLSAGLVLAASGVFALVGIYRMWQLSKLQREYVAALSLLRRIGRIRPFVVTYRDLS